VQVAFVVDVSYAGRELVRPLRPRLSGLPIRGLGDTLGSVARAVGTLERLTEPSSQEPAINSTIEEVKETLVQAKELVVNQFFSVYYAAFDGKLVITTSREGIADLRADDGRLADDEAFKDAAEAAGMPAETTGFLYVDLDQALPVLSGLMGFSGQATPDWLDRNLEPLQSFVLYGERDGDVARLVGLLSIQ